MRGQRRRLHLRPFRQRRARAAVEAAADDVRVRRAEARTPVLRGYAETRYARQVLGQRAPGRRPHRGQRRWASISATSSPARHGHAPSGIYDSLYCARGQAENLIKLHKAQLASDRTSCRSPLRQPDAARPAHRRLLAAADPARPHPQAALRWPAPSSPRSGCRCSRSPAASSRPQAGCASPSPPPARTPRCSAPRQRAQPAGP